MRDARAPWTVGLKRQRKWSGGSGGCSLLISLTRGRSSLSPAFLFSLLLSPWLPSFHILVCRRVPFLNPFLNGLSSHSPCLHVRLLCLGNALLDESHFFLCFQAVVSTLCPFLLELPSRRSWCISQCRVVVVVVVVVDFSGTFDTNSSTVDMFPGPAKGLGLTKTHISFNITTKLRPIFLYSICHSEVFNPHGSVMGKVSNSHLLVLLLHLITVAFNHTQPRNPSQAHAHRKGLSMVSSVSLCFPLTSATASSSCPAPFQDPSTCFSNSNRVIPGRAGEITLQI